MKNTERNDNNAETVPNTVKSGEVSRNKLIIAAANELEQHGISSFSIRRVANVCGVSCGAPYKHFSSKSALIVEVIRYMNNMWSERQLEIIKASGNGTREKLIDICEGYVVFLHEHPEFQALLMINEDKLDSEQRSERAKISSVSEALIKEYCRVNKYSDDVLERETFYIRSLIYGFAFMLNSGALSLCDKTMNMIRSYIAREFDIV